MQVLGVCIDHQPYMMVLEFLENGDLKSFLQKHGRERTNFDKLLLICEDVKIFVFFARTCAQSFYTPNPIEGQRSCILLPGILDFRITV